MQGLQQRLQTMKKLLSLICIVLMTACGSSEREQKLADEVLGLKTAQIQQTAQIQKETNQKITKLREDFTTQIEELYEEIENLNRQLAAATTDHAAEAEGGGAEAEGGGHGTHSGEAEEDNPKKPEPIVPEGEAIVINPAGSGGTRYLLVEIFLLRKDEKDIYFPKAISTNTKLLQAATVDWLSAENVESLADPATKEKFKAAMKKSYQETLGPKHPIKQLIVSKWIMQ